MILSALVFPPEYHFLTCPLLDMSEEGVPNHVLHRSSSSSSSMSQGDPKVILYVLVFPREHLLTCPILDMSEGGAPVGTQEHLNDHVWTTF